MKPLVTAAFVVTMGLSAGPALAMPVTPGVSTDHGLVQRVEDGCARGYYKSYGRCIPNSAVYGGRRYRYQPEYYDEPPPVYEEQPRYYVRPRYYEQPRYYAPAYPDY